MDLHCAFPYGLQGGFVGIGIGVFIHMIALESVKQLCVICVNVLHETSKSDDLTTTNKVQNYVEILWDKL